MKETLSTALALMFGHEGGYVNNPADPGGPTKYGVTLRTLAAHRGKPVTAADVRALTLSEAEEVYRRSYWTQSGGDLLPAGLDYAAFDFGVNSGPAIAVKKLQALVGVAADGIVGGQTVEAAAKYPGGINKLIRDYCGARMTYLRGLGTWGKFGRGWTIRVTGKDPKGQWKDAPGVVGNALRLAASGAPIIPVQPTPPQAKAPPSDKSVIEIAKEQPSLVVSLLTALGAFAAGAGPIQWALGAAVVAGIVYAGYRVIKKERAAG